MEATKRKRRSRKIGELILFPFDVWKHSSGEAIQRELVIYRETKKWLQTAQSKIKGKQ